MTSHSTTVVYSVPAGVKPKQIAGFYGRQLRGWEHQQDGNVFPCGTPVQRSCFAKGEAIVSVNIDRRHKTFSLVVDHQGAANGYYGGN